MAVQEKPVTLPVVNPSPLPESIMAPSEPFVYSGWYFFRAMWLIAWSALAHPFSSSVIDLETGRVVHGDVES